MVGAASLPRERRWLVLGADGRHVWLGRATDPSTGEVAQAEQALAAQGTSGWLAVSEGDYWAVGEPMTLLIVRPLGGPSRDGWEQAVRTFEELRAEVLGVST